MSDAMLFSLGIAAAGLVMGLWHWSNHSAPTASRVELRRKAFLRAKALYVAEAAALQAYYTAIGPLKAQRDAQRAADRAMTEVADVRP